MSSRNNRLCTVITFHRKREKDRRGFVTFMRGKETRSIKSVPQRVSDPKYDCNR